jgi:1,4-alpha-glucan branching enzyme
MKEVAMARITKSVSAELRLHAPQAKRVNLAGTFNNWDIRKTPAKRINDGTWIAKLSLKPGRYEYKFIVDGNWINDPNCRACVPNSFGSQNCVLEVKQ